MTERRIILDLATGAVRHDPPLKPGEKLVTPWGEFKRSERDAADQAEKEAL